MLKNNQRSISIETCLTATPNIWTVKLIILISMMLKMAAYLKFGLVVPQIPSKRQNQPEYAATRKTFNVYVQITNVGML